jgi:hypothetical protein
MIIFVSRPICNEFCTGVCGARTIKYNMISGITNVSKNAKTRAMFSRIL